MYCCVLFYIIFRSIMLTPAAVFFFVWLNYILGFPNHLQLVRRPAPKLNVPRNKLISPHTSFHRLSFINRVIDKLIPTFSKIIIFQQKLEPFIRFSASSQLSSDGVYMNTLGKLRRIPQVPSIDRCSEPV